MTKGTPAFGRKSGKTRFVQRCRRCGVNSYRVRQKRCSACGYGRSPTMRKYTWNKKKKMPKVMAKKPNSRKARTKK